ncbi:hypothetical protein B0H13DRAFT_1159363 [Mycena leptocephala]|nr:hypothetical protein B0H13DRAFT_1159363 [Mycena leptocephala]
MISPSSIRDSERAALREGKSLYVGVGAPRAPCGCPTRMRCRDWGHSRISGVGAAFGVPWWAPATFCKERIAVLKERDWAVLSCSRWVATVCEVKIHAGNASLRLSFCASLPPPSRLLSPSRHAISFLGTLLFLALIFLPSMSVSVSIRICHI